MGRTAKVEPTVRQIQANEELTGVVTAIAGMPQHGTSKSSGEPWTRWPCIFEGEDFKGQVSLFGNIEDVQQLLGSEQTFVYEGLVSTKNGNYPKLSLKEVAWTGVEFV